MSVNPTYRRLIVAGPIPEVRWLVERARGRLGAPVVEGSRWRSRVDLSFRSLAELLPRERRPVPLPEEIDQASLNDFHETRSGAARARWSLTDFVWQDASQAEALLAALSQRYPSVMFIAAWEEPDTFEAESCFVRRGRIRRWRVPSRRVEQLRREIYARHELESGGDDEFDESAADDELDIALLDVSEQHWEPFSAPKRRTRKRKRR